MQPNASAVDELLAELTIERPQANQQAKTFIGKTFVITGAWSILQIAVSWKSYIEEAGRKVDRICDKEDGLFN